MNFLDNDINGEWPDLFITKNPFLITNEPPVANANGPYMVADGGSVSLTGSGTDPDGDPLTYLWDLDNDGIFETTEQNPHIFSTW